MFTLFTCFFFIFHQIFCVFVCTILVVDLISARWPISFFLTTVGWRNRRPNLLLQVFFFFFSLHGGEMKSLFEITCLLNFWLFFFFFSYFFRSFRTLQTYNFKLLKVLIQWCFLFLHLNYVIVCKYCLYICVFNTWFAKKLFKYI